MFVGHHVLRPLDRPVALWDLDLGEGTRVPEAELDVREVDDVAVFQGHAGHALAVDERAVRAFEVADAIAPVGDVDAGVFFRDLAGIDGCGRLLRSGR
jgi:hypothetical protein